MSLCLNALQIMGQNIKPLPPISADIQAGTILSLMGPSGIGKSTILAAIAGHLPTELKVKGSVVLDGRDILRLKPENRQIGILFQDALLFPHLSVAQNIQFGMPHHYKDRNVRAHDALASMGLVGFDNRDPSTLSGGEAARVALLRSLLAEPKAILLDEPFSALDQDLRREIREVTFAEIRKRQIPALMVTHDLEDAKASGDDIIKLTSN